jgi:hypothetical protein
MKLRGMRKWAWQLPVAPKAHRQVLDLAVDAPRYFFYWLVEWTWAICHPFYRVKTNSCSGVIGFRNSSIHRANITNIFYFLFYSTMNPLSIPTAHKPLLL